MHYRAHTYRLRRVQSRNPKFRPYPHFPEPRADYDTLSKPVEQWEIGWRGANKIRSIFNGILKIGNFIQQRIREKAGAGGCSTGCVAVGAAVTVTCIVVSVTLSIGLGVGLGPNGDSLNLTSTGWSNTGSMNTGRYLHTASVLANGKVLVAGGYSNTGITSSAELYDSSAGSWTTTGNMSNARYLHTSSLLTNGKVLVAGGWNLNLTNYLYSTELYDPSTGNWATTGNMNNARWYHTASVLTNGKVLVVGGSILNPNGSYYLYSAELYDPSTGTWTFTGNTTDVRIEHTASVLTNGKVLVAGGTVSYIGGYGVTAELYDPSAGSWTTTGNMTNARFLHTSSVLTNGKVLVAGGWNFVNTTLSLNSAELYDPSKGTWTATGNMNSPRAGHTASVLTNGKVLVIGGLNFNGSYTNTDELYDPSTGTWATTGNMSNTRYGHTASVLTSGIVLVAGGIGTGGFGTSGILNSTELYQL